MDQQEEEVNDFQNILPEEIRAEDKKIKLVTFFSGANQVHQLNYHQNIKNFGLHYPKSNKTSLVHSFNSDNHCIIYMPLMKIGKPLNMLMKEYDKRDFSIVFRFAHKNTYMSGARELGEI